MKEINSFNPCFYGSYSFTYQIVFMIILLLQSFNPCFYGSYSFTKTKYIYLSLPSKVLILVFMEVILLRCKSLFLACVYLSFNPCFYGSYSFTRRNSTHWNNYILDHSSKYNLIKIHIFLSKTWLFLCINTPLHASYINHFKGYCSILSINL